MKTLTLIFCFWSFGVALAQRTAIEFELNGKPSHEQLMDSIEISKNPFTRFMGEWTLKDDRWIQNWGDKTDTIRIANHHTVSRQLNTQNSLLSIIDGPEPNGHIFWSYNPNTKEVSHLSSFGTIRAGVGQGTFDEKGDLSLKIRFEGEPNNTYRIYHYSWISKDSYNMRSIQYDNNHRPTGLFYEGTFNRIRQGFNTDRERKVFFDALKNQNEDDLRNYIHPNGIFMLEYQKTLKGHEQILAYYEKVFDEYKIVALNPLIEEVIELPGYKIEIGLFSQKIKSPRLKEPFQQNGKFWCIWKETTGGYKLYAYAQGYHRELTQEEYVVVDKGIVPANNGNLELRAYAAYGEKAIKNWDAQMRIDLYAEDAIFYPFADKAKVGLEVLKPYLKDYHKGDVEIDHIKVLPYEYVYLEDHILEYSLFEVDWRFKENSGTNEGKGIRLWKRQPDNSLKIYRHIGLHNQIER
ncbi:Cif family virulence factor [Poritiphilus flavus]|uniref:Uncharacterized protein n=1 Tax=Poritiphilus flavus TaxID=2697053 RepID=A0A6L9E938_9FLAO|nr:hypothetical protein [Poritiphilus flavus]NAS11144.1 hypothetical protein [Poritiphilus flavus]